VESSEYLLSQRKHKDEEACACIHGYVSPMNAFS
jgi:hypothetical protein